MPKLVKNYTCFRIAIIYSAQANRGHGVRMTAEDKRKAVITFLSDREWQQWADTVIAKACGVSPSMVARYRGFMHEAAGTKPEEMQRTYFDREGKKRVRTVPVPSETPMETSIKGETCPYCGQKMPGRKHGSNRARGRWSRN